MNIDQIISQIRTYAPIFSNNVAGAAQYANSVPTQTWLPLPAAYVIPSGSKAEPSRTQTGLRQMITETFVVAVVLDNAVNRLDDRRGQIAATQIETIEAALWRALLNWRMDPLKSAGGLSYGGYEIVQMDNSRLFVEFTFANSIQITDDDGFIVPSVPLQEIDIQFGLNGNPVSTTVAITGLDT